MKGTSPNSYIEMVNKKLFIDAITFEKGKAFGFNEYLFNLLNYFYKNRDALLFNEIVLVINESQTEYFSHFTDKFKLKTVKCKNFLFRGLNQSFWNISRDIRPQDVILFTSNYSSLWPKGIKILVIHDLLYKHKELASLGLMGFQRKIFVPISIRQAQKIICISNFTESEVQFFYPISKGKTEVIYNHLEYDKFGIQSNKSRTGFLTVASSSPHKNTVLIIKAFSSYVAKGGKEDLVIVGKLNQSNDELIRNLDPIVRNRISILSHISNCSLGELYSKKKVYISASKFEGLGMPIAEAMYFKMLLILPNRPSIFSEICSGNALFFDSRCIDDLCCKMLQCDSLNNCNVVYDLDKFSLENTAKKYIEVINSLV